MKKSASKSTKKSPHKKAHKKVAKKLSAFGKLKRVSFRAHALITPGPAGPLR